MSLTDFAQSKRERDARLGKYGNAVQPASPAVAVPIRDEKEEMQSRIANLEKQVARLTKFAFADSPIADRAKVPTVRQILRLVGSHFGMTETEMLARRTFRDQTAARHIAVHIIAKITPHSLPAIARAVNRDRSTILYAINKMAREIQTDKDLANLINGFIRKLNEGDNVPVES